MSAAVDVGTLRVGGHIFVLISKISLKNYFVLNLTMIKANLHNVVIFILPPPTTPPHPHTPKKKSFYWFTVRRSKSFLYVQKKQ